jgi:transcriptional regulator with XRE-family HTH domain
MLNLEVIGQKIANLRKQKDMTQQELADSLYVSRQAISKWERGEGLPSIEILSDLTKLFEVSIDYILDSSDILENDYQTMMQQYPRESVIYKYLNSSNLNEDFKSIFYLLKQEERKKMIDLFLSRNLNVDIFHMWPYLNQGERSYMLYNIRSKKIDVDNKELCAMMNDEERIIFQNCYVIHKGKEKRQ